MSVPRPLRSLRNRLTLIFALIVFGAIGIVYFYVTPRLEDQLVQQKLTRLAASAGRESALIKRRHHDAAEGHRGGRRRGGHARERAK